MIDLYNRSVVETKRCQNFVVFYKKFLRIKRRMYRDVEEKKFHICQCKIMCKKMLVYLLSQNNLPSPLNPSGHVHLYEPRVLEHFALIPQAFGLVLHSLMSMQPPSG